MPNLDAHRNNEKMETKEAQDALFEFATEGILIANEKGEIIRINPSAEKMFGYDKGELNYKKVEVLIPKRAEKRHLDHREKFNGNPHPRNMGIGVDLFGLKKNGTEIPVEVSLSPFATSEGKFVIAFIVDITQRKKTEDALKKNREELQLLAGDLQVSNIELEKRVKDRTLILEEALQQLERSKEELSVALEKEKELSELKSRFVSMASHEFRTPLATILSSLSLSSKYAESGEKEKQDKHIARIKAAVVHMTDLMNDVLSISKLEEGKISISPEKVLLEDFTKGIVSEMQTVSKDGQKIIYTHQGGSEIFIDKKILKNLLFNLISNAIKFSSEEKNIEVKSSVSEDVIEISVRDHGIGISKEDQKHLFERFFRGENAVNIQGTGLGLNIAVKYVELMEGSISVESELGEGTKFIIVLPNNKAFVK